ncbi:hypothetical protein [Pseudokineococcus sp. 1T1Z-3]|uniref:hypothetical protein n=1 Tax=Pseudokineococcus sp. 1T1Z-3 TaxID=3132745 RepID=UPI0030ACFAB3
MSFSSPFGSAAPGGAGGGVLPGPRRGESADVETVVLGGVPRVDLLPASVAAGDRFRRLQVGLGAALGVLLLGAAGVTLLAGTQVGAAQEQLTEEQGRTAALQAEMDQYAEVPLLRSTQETVGGVRDAALADDVLWYRYSARLANTLPTDLRLTTLAMALADATAASGATSAAAATTTTDGSGAEPATIGTMTLSLEGRVVPDSADLLDVLAQVPGLADPWTDSTTAGGDTGGTTVQAHVDVTDEALSQRYSTVPTTTTTTAATTDGDEG